MVGRSFETDLHHETVPGHGVLDGIGLGGGDRLHGGGVQGDGIADQVADRDLVVGQGGTGPGVHGLEHDSAGAGLPGGLLHQGAVSVLPAPRRKGEEEGAKSGTESGHGGTMEAGKPDPQALPPIPV
jgi:hypothetical protein